MYVSVPKRNYGRRTHTPAITLNVRQHYIFTMNASPLSLRRASDNETGHSVCLVTPGVTSDVNETGFETGLQMTSDDGVAKL